MKTIHYQNTRTQTLSMTDSESSSDDDFLSALGTIRDDIQTQADEIQKDFDTIKSEQKNSEEKRLAAFEEIKKGEESKAEERRLKRKEVKDRRRRIESARERGNGGQNVVYNVFL